MRARCLLEDDLREYKAYQKVLVCMLPFASLIILYFVSIFVLKYIKFPPCMFYVTTGFHCISCGATRSVEALVNGDILLSIRQNALVIIGIIYAILFYVELFCAVVLGKKVRTPAHNIKFFYVFIIFLVVYSVLRNIFPIIAPI